MRPHQRIEFASLARPAALEAQTVLHRIRRFQHLQALLQEARQLAKSASEEEKDGLSIRIQIILDDIAEMGGENGYKLSLEAFRSQRNEVTRIYNQLVISGLPGSAETASLFTQPQLKDFSTSLEMKEKDSPPQLHHMMGDLAIYRSKTQNPRFRDQVSSIVRTKNIEPQIIDLSLATIQHMPSHLVKPESRSAPLGYRSYSEIASNAVEISKLLISDNLPTPTDEQVGRKSPEQKKHIADFLTNVTLAYLKFEMAHPELSEKEIKQLYDNLGRIVRQLSTHVIDSSYLRSSSYVMDYGAKNHAQSNAYDLVAESIEQMPESLAIILTSRLSVNLTIDLGFPVAYLADEKRLIEILRTSVGAKREYRGPGDVPHKQRRAHQAALAVLEERLSEECIDCDKLFGYLEEGMDEGHGELVLKNILATTTDEQLEAFYLALIQTNRFPQIQRQLHTEFEGSEDADFVLDLDEIALSSENSNQGRYHRRRRI